MPSVYTTAVGLNGRADIVHVLLHTAMYLCLVLHVSAKFSLHILAILAVLIYQNTEHGHGYSILAAS